jgi:hypothetical protein
MAIFLVPAFLKAVTALLATTALNDIAQESLIRVLRKFEGSDPTRISTTILDYISSNQDIEVGIKLKDKNDYKTIYHMVSNSGNKVSITTKNKDFDLVMAGKPKAVIESLNIFNDNIQSQSMLSPEDQGNTLFGRITSKAKGFFWKS